MAKDRARIGRKIFRKIHKSRGKEVMARLRQISPDYTDMVTDFAFGEIYARPGLDLRARQIATIAALTALSNAPTQLEAHMEGGLNLGLTSAEILEIVLQMALYGGFAAAANGLVAAEAAFAAHAAQAKQKSKTRKSKRVSALRAPKRGRKGARAAP